MLLLLASLTVEGDQRGRVMNKDIMQQEDRASQEYPEASTL
jgi:hypothetical protein